MANLTRYKQKIFANNSDQVGVFGTGVDKETSKNVETLQSEAYEGGWSEAIITNKNYPIWQEMDGVQYGFSYQLAYLLQKGIPQWLATETYYTNDYCRVGSEIYYSLQDNNIGKNPTSESTYWTPLLTANRSIGEVIPSTIPLTEAGLHLLDGSLIQGTGIYADFVTYMVNLTATHPERFTTEANWQTAVTNTGVCDKFVYDSVNNTIRLPKWGNQAITKTISTASTVPVVGNGKTLGLTDGTTNFGFQKYNDTANYECTTGAYGTSAGTSVTSDSTGSVPATWKTLGVTTNSSNSGLVANTSSLLTQYPLNCYYYIVVATSTKTDIQVDIDEIATDLNGKADVDLTNLTNTGNIKMAHSAMPSDLYENITVGASEASYQAPADGYFAARGVSTAANGFALLCLDTGAYFGNSTGMTWGPGLGCNAVLPVRKGDYVYLIYGNVNFSAFRFYYAVGSESEVS